MVLIRAAVNIDIAFCIVNGGCPAGGLDFSCNLNGRYRFIGLAGLCLSVNRYFYRNFICIGIIINKYAGLVQTG